MNLKDLTYHKKNRLLLFGSVAFLVFVYFFTISDTIDLLMEHQVVKEKLAEAQNAPAQITTLEARMLKMDEQVGMFMSSADFTQDTLIDLVSRFCNENHLDLKEYPSPDLNKENDYRIATNRIVAQGSYANLLKLAYALEQEFRVGRIASLQFNSLKNNKTKKLYLNATILLQNYKKVEQ